MIDMDEFLCVTEDELLHEIKNETSILEIKGLEMIGESNKTDLTDIDLQKINKYVDKDEESKKLCFLREKITEMNYELGAHHSKPRGYIKYSSKIYYNKHMNTLGLNYIIDKTKKRYTRSELMLKQGLAGHYAYPEERVKKNYYHLLNNCKFLL